MSWKAATISLSVTPLKNLSNSFFFRENSSKITFKYAAKS